MTTNQILASTALPHGMSAPTADDNAQTRRNCLWLYARGYVELRVKWATLTETTDTYFGTLYARSVKLETLHLTKAGRAYWNS